MATIHSFTVAPPSFSLSKPRKILHRRDLNFRLPRSSTHRRLTVAEAYKVVVEYEGKKTELEVEEDETILSKALDNDLPVPYDCMLGVCMTCPARLLSGKVDQSEGMLSDDVVERGYALMCASYPRSDCHIQIIPEEELLSLQLATAND
ncbi:ferredoxin C 1, chloroplastic [Impatiens glandulifera]|uniref:ferredoxin C 1, chloroplastic n=1 Tax=Impatiens glandulifera TaxID=253017 RepID=UPI001FB155E4|nr:ferredoxin C 1, chloroplastic [Impatiens glandulifera]